MAEDTVAAAHSQTTAGEVSIDPLSQFQVHTVETLWKKFTGQDYTSVDQVIAPYAITNVAIWMVLASLAAFFLLRSVRGGSLVPTRWQSIGELTYTFISSLVSDTAGKAAKPYFPFVLSLFLFILMGNLFGMFALMGWEFTITSQLVVTVALALTVFILVTTVGLVRHGFGFFRLFVPAGAPWWIMPLLVPLEVISYLVRPLSLSVRLFANMLAGHALVKVLGSMVPLVFSFGFGATTLIAVVPIAMLIPIIGLEFMVACIQAYVFTLLTCVYLHDALYLH